MPLPRRTLCLFLVVTAVVTLSAAGIEVRPRKGWLQLQSPNFLLIGDVGGRDLRQVAERLEQFREALGIMFPKAILTTPTPTTVIVFRSHKSFEPLKPVYQGKALSNIAGFFQAGPAINYVALTLEGGLDNLGIIYHEYVHLIVNNTVNGIPVWFNEGLAEYYRTFQVSDSGDRAFIGRIQDAHVLLLREQFLPLESLVAVDHRSPLYNESSKASIFYAESWALVHYLVFGEDQKFAKNAAAFAAALGNGQSLDAAAHATLGVTGADLEKGLRRYISRNVFLSRRVSFSDRIAKIGAVEPTSIDEADIHATLGDVLIQMRRKEEAQAELGAALALDDAHGPAHASLGMMDVREGRWDASRPHFERAVASRSTNYLCHYYYGVALAQTAVESGSPTPDDIAVVERSFRRAIDLNPAFADSYAQLAWVVGRAPDRTQDAAQLMLKALKLAPGRQDYLFGLGNLLANAQDFVAAKQLLTPLAARAVDEQIRDQARQRLAQIVDYEKRRAEWEASARTSGAPRAPSSNGSSTDEASSRIILKLRELKTAETRYSGRLVAIECGPKGIVLVAKVDEGTVRARAAQFDAIEFITYLENSEGRVECGSRKTPENVLLTLQLDAGTRLNGVAVAVEFVPDDYKPQP